MAIIAPAPPVKIETSKSNLEKLSRLLTVIQTGELDGITIRPPMQVKDICSIAGVSRKTFGRWRDGKEMPQPRNLRAIAEDLLMLSPQQLEQYFRETISLRELLTIKSKSYTPDDIYQAFGTLGDRDKDIVLALLLRDRAQNLGNDLVKTSSNLLVSSSKNDGDTIVASNLGEGLPQKAADRLKNLLHASRAKYNQENGTELSFYEILRTKGVDPRNFIEVIRAAAAGEISLDCGIRIFPNDWDALALICFQVTSWQNSHPVQLQDQLYLSGELLRRSLMENGEPRPALR